MNYIRVYWSIIHNRLHNKVDGYVEHHHIIPRSEGGSDNKSNIVALTAREHYICHLLLAKIYNDYKMLSAVVFMQCKATYHHRYFKFNSRLYACIRKEFAEKQKNKIPWNKGKKCKPLTDLHKKKLSQYSSYCRWYNNGKINKFCIECPDGFVNGRLSTNRLLQANQERVIGRKWFNNGIVQKRVRTCPGPEWKRGRIKNKKLRK